MISKYLSFLSYITAYSTTLLYGTLQEKPNIVYILADDMGQGDVRAYNSDSKFPTPHLDEMASNGMMFTDAHTNSSVCTPTRYGILTGRYAWRTKMKGGVTGGLSPHLIQPGRETVASWLQQQGYKTACIGKWHLGMDWTLKDGSIATVKSKGEDVDLSKRIKNGPNSNGFDHFFGIPASANHAPHCFIENGYVKGRLKVLDAKEKKLAGIDGKEGLAAEGWVQSEILPTFTRKTCDWMTQHVKANPEQPFFVYMPLNSPHSPIVPSAKFSGQSQLGPHGDFCMETDWALGEVMKTLEDLGVKENTLVIFTADNGTSPMAKFEMMQAKGHYPSHIYRGLKGSTFEGGHRVPFLVQWPAKVKAATVSDQVICTTDLMATCADLLGQTLSENIAEDSVSFLPALEGRNIPELKRRGVVHHSDAGAFAIRVGKWKLLLDSIGGSRRSNPKDQPIIESADILLFDMDKDAGETQNLSRKYPEVVHSMMKQLASYINLGRSTKGQPVMNEEPTKDWSQIYALRDYLSPEILKQLGDKVPKSIIQKTVENRDKKNAEKNEKRSLKRKNNKT